MSKMLRRELLTLIKTPHLLPYTIHFTHCHFTPYTIQNTASTSRFKQEFFHVGHKTTAHSISCGSK